MDEGDEATTARPGAGVTVASDNSAGRLLALSDGVFAIAMTLLALDLKVPSSVGKHPTDQALRTALLHNSGSYWSFLITFYVVGSLWNRHRRLMRAVERTDPALIRDTLVLLLLVAVMPFPASLLGEYGSEPISLAVYGAINAASSVTFMVLSRDVRRLTSTGRGLDESADYAHSAVSWLNLVVFLLCIPAGYVLGSHGPLVLILLAWPRRLIWLGSLRRRRRT